MDLRHTLPNNNTYIRTLQDVKSLDCRLGPVYISLEFTNASGHTLTTGEYVPEDWYNSQKEPEMYLELFKAVQHLRFINPVENLIIGADELDGDRPISTTFPEEEWRSLFNKIPLLKSLILRGVGLSPVYLALAPTHDEATQLCPSLEILVIKGYSDFREAKGFEMWFEGIMEELLEFTQRRHSAGRPLRTIQLPFMDSEAAEDEIYDDVEFWRLQFGVRVEHVAKPKFVDDSGSDWLY
jgi:hypothetical protein